MSGGPGGFEGAARGLAQAIDRSVARAVEGEDLVAVAFSGGVDSSILVACAKPRVRVVACTGYSGTARDSTVAAVAAKELGVDLASVELTPENVTPELARLSLPFEPSIMDRSLWCLYSLVAREAGKSGARVMLLGQLADELFGGYRKYADALEGEGAEAAIRMMEADRDGYLQTGQIRDKGACGDWVEPRFPFMDGEVVGCARTIPVDFKVKDGVRKAVLRRAAVLLGVPEGMAGTAKKAAQYSSGAQKLVSGLAF